MPQDALLLPEYKLLQGALQLLGYVTVANSSSVRRKLALLCFNPWNNSGCNLLCIGALSAALLLLISCILDTHRKIKGVVSVSLQQEH